MIVTLSSRNKNTTLTHKYSVTKYGHLKEKCVQRITLLWMDSSLINSGALSQRNSARILSCYPLTSISGQISVCVREDGQKKTGDQGHSCDSERQLMGQTEDGFSSRCWEVPISIYNKWQMNKACLSGFNSCQTQPLGYNLPIRVVLYGFPRH